MLINLAKKLIRSIYNKYILVIYIRQLIWQNFKMHIHKFIPAWLEDGIKLVIE